MTSLPRTLRPILASLAACGLAIGCATAEPPRPPERPATVDVEVLPEAVTTGGETAVTVRLEPVKGIKINRYPEATLRVEASALVAAAEARIGSATPPPPEKMATNYFDRVDPLQLTLEVAEGAAAGVHEIDATLSYFYCMPANGFCAPKRESVRIPLTVR